MRLLLTGDWHISTNKPERRTDDYWLTVQQKLGFIFRLCEKEDVKIILQPGDFFNTHKANDFLKRYMIKQLMDRQIKVYTVFGQHDLRYHSSDIKNTPLAVLYAAKAVHIVGVGQGAFRTGAMDIYGASWFEDIPEIEDPDTFNILITHRMIIKNEKLWDGQEGATMGNILLKTHGYDLIVSGDNHQHFTISTKSGRHLVNCGSLIRTKIDQVDHTPLIYIYDTKGQTITPHEVPCEPFAKVFDMSKYEAEKTRDEKLEAFVSRITGDIELDGLDFVKNLDTYIEENEEEIDETTLLIIEEVMA